MNADILITVSGTAQGIPVLILEHLDFKNPLRFKNGKWGKIFKDFPIDTDRDLDYALLTFGIPGQECVVTVSAKYNNKEKSKESKDTFGPKGWAIIKDDLKL